ncbi:MAG TPA: hypothetical protein VN455_11865 [Methanotrichaceae archaeon]|nr:hypothetical protein [Methanotrichaceae archaeon]
MYLGLISDGRIGYDINVNVDGIHWGRSQSTMPMNLKIDGSCNGTGNSNKYVQIAEMAGIGLSDRTHTDKGILNADEKINLSTSVTEIIIDESYSNTANRYTVDIDEEMPTYLTDESRMAYQGDGIYTKNNYANNGDDVFTNYYGSYLTKSIRYAAIYQNATVHAEVGPTQAKESLFRNAAWAFRVSSNSDTYSGLGYSLKEGCQDDSYYGSYQINERLTRGSKYFNLSRNDDWLGCCPALYLALSDNGLDRLMAYDN